MTGTIDDATLVAYVDGELDAPTTQQVEALMARDPEVAESVRALRETKSLLCAAFTEPEKSGVPLKLYGAIQQAFEKAGAQRNRGGAAGGGATRGWTAASGIAASLVAVIVGLTAGYLVADHRIERRLAEIEAQHAADHRAMEAAISRGLETELSGVEVEWHSADSGSSGSVTPIRTFKTKSGQWCREYSAKATLGEANEDRRAIACRGDDGIWRTRLVLLAES